MCENSNPYSQKRMRIKWEKKDTTELLSSKSFSGLLYYRWTTFLYLYCIIRLIDLYV